MTEFCYAADVAVRLASPLQWSYGDLNPMAAVWVDDEDNKQGTPVLTQGGVAHRVLVPFRPPINESTVYIEIYDDEPPKRVDPYVGTAEFSLDDYKLGERLGKQLPVICPEGQTCGMVEVYVMVLETDSGDEGGRAGARSRSGAGAKKKGGLIGGIVKGIGGALSDDKKKKTGGSGGGGGGGAGGMVGKAAGGIIKGFMKKKKGGKKERGEGEGEGGEEGEEGEEEEGERSGGDEEEEEEEERSGSEEEEDEEERR